MADAKLSALSGIGTIALDDLFYVVDDPAGTPASTKATTQQMQAAMGLVHTAGSDADTTLIVGAMHVFDVGAFTADRTATLPATAAVGDRCGIIVSTGDDAYELLITAASGDTLNGIAGGTEWSRVFITGEVVIFRCISANATWVAELDGRIPQVGLMRLSTNADGESAATFTRPTQAASAGAWTAYVNIGSICSTSGDSMVVRRAGRYNLSYVGLIKDAVTDQQYHGAALYHNGTTNILHAATMQASGSSSPQSSTGVVLGYPMETDETVVYQYRTQPGSLGLSAAAAPRIASGFSMVEVLP